MSQSIDGYQPRHASSAWPRVEAEVRRIVEAAQPDAPYSAKDLLGPLSKLALFADGRGMTPDAAVWLNRETIEAFIAAGCPTIAESTRGNYRTRLLRLREVLFGPDLPGGRPARISGATLSTPYSRTEQTDLWSSASGQPTDYLRRGVKTLLALGLGCGLDSPEIITARTQDVRRFRGNVEIAVRGPRARTVVCRAAWENVLLDAAGQLGSGSWLFRPEAASREKNTVTNFIGRTRPADGVARLVMGRARATWIVELLNARTPAQVIVAAAGIESFHAISRLLSHVDAIAADEAARFLRGAV